MRPQTRRAKNSFIEPKTLQTYDRNRMRNAYNAPTSEKKRQEQEEIQKQKKKKLFLKET